MNALPFWAYALRSAVVVLVLFVAFRLLGKREAATLNVYDLAMIMALSNGVQNAMTGGRGDLAVGLASSTGVILLAYGFTRVFVRSPEFERRVLGDPVIILENGKILEERMRHESVSRDELFAAFRQHGLTSPSQVRLAVFEIDGSISIVPK